MSKSFRIEPIEGTSLCRIAYVGGGEVPDALKGSFTSTAIAKQFIASWQSVNPEREQAPVEVVKRGDDTARPKPKSMTSI